MLEVLPGIVGAELPGPCARLHFYILSSARRIKIRKIPAERCRTDSAGTDSGAQRKPHFPSKRQKLLFVPPIRMDPSSKSGYVIRGPEGLQACLESGWYCLRVQNVYCHSAIQCVLLRFDDFQFLTSRNFVVHAFLERVHCIIFAGPLLAETAGPAALQNKIESCILGHSSPNAFGSATDFGGTARLRCTFSDHPVLVAPSNRSTGI